ncbi:hypothetical protein BH09SUM1_BH09SUM1_06770 [soil metagenome]
MATRKYELMLILDPARTEEQQVETLNKIDEVITKYGGTPDKREVWGKRRLAYPVDRRRDGYYALVYFDVEPTSEVLAEIERTSRYSEEILRSLVTVAVVGKTVGNPALDREREERQARFQTQRGFERRPRRDENAPAAAPVEGGAVATEAAPAAPEVDNSPANPALPEIPTAAQ